MNYPFADQSPLEQPRCGFCGVEGDMCDREFSKTCPNMPEMQNPPLTLQEKVRDHILDAWGLQIAEEAGVHTSYLHDGGEHLVDQWIDGQSTSWLLGAISNALEDD